MARFDLSTYVTVQDRINTFWQAHPDGAIRTALVSNPSEFNQVVFRAEVYKDRNSATPDGVGHAAEEATNDPKGGPNYTSWHENAETSAIGRAFANMGYATSQKDRPSREEMEKVDRGRPANNGNRQSPERLTSWTDFWAWARENGFEKKAQIEKFIGGAMPDDPQVAKDTIDSLIPEPDEDPQTYGQHYAELKRDR